MEYDIENRMHLQSSAAIEKLVRCWVRKRCEEVRQLAKVQSCRESIYD